MNINGSTRLIGLMGNPVEHTLSPVIHNSLSDAMGISSVYVPFKVEEEGVGKAVKGAYELNILGLNVTVPHKNRVMDYLVEIDDTAKHIGAVNTLVRSETKHGYKGYNTDMLGLQRQIREDGIHLSGRTVVILGAGGAAKAVVYMCVTEGAKRIYLLNRTINKACDIAEYMNNLVNNNVVIPMCIDDYNNISEDNIIVFQATSIGLFPNENETVINVPSFYKKIDIGIDLIYNPAETKFMKLVKDNGGRAYNALKMLLYQGIIAYELWHNIAVPDELAKEIYIRLKKEIYHDDNIVLIGFMGSGKSTVGKALAKKLSMDYIDTDEYIEKKAGMAISEIFENKGEQEFRRIETEVLVEFKDKLSNTVLSTGGGMPLRDENSVLLNDIGKVFYLRVAENVLYDRLKNDKERPLLQCEDPFERICILLKERSPLYEKACDIVIDNSGNDLEKIIKSIISYIG